ncbi:MAG: DUF1214 domain-containing protein [Pseudomonadota bacterium]
MQNKLLITLAVIAGLALGYVTSYLAIPLLKLPGTFQTVGPWMSQTNMASSDTDWYTRARTARYAAYGLPRSEVIYFGSFTDSKGQKLSHKCVYKVTIPDPPARWWSLALYRNGNYIPNKDDRYSIGATTIDRQPGETMTITLNADGLGRNALALGDGPGPFHPIYKLYGSFALAFRLYQPHQEALRAVSENMLPKIEKMSCEN